MITYPSRIIPATGYLLIIALGGCGIPISSDVSNEIRIFFCIYRYMLTSTLMTRVVTSNYNKNQICQQNDAGSRGKGLFDVDLYASNADACAMTAWDWGVSHVIAERYRPHR